MLLCLGSGLGFSGTDSVTQDDLMLMPYPANVELKAGKFRLNKDFTIAHEGKAHERLFAQATRMLRRLDGKTGFFFTQEFVTPDPKPGAELMIKTRRPGEVKFGEDESYELSVGENQITLSATNDIGAIRGMETLLQLLQADEEGYYFPAVEIRDQPRFPWRGLMIDVARHFQPIDVIKRNLDGMAAVKMNVLHLHLVDDQGFRVESKVYPQLHEKASDGKYFTQQDIKEIISYASERGIRVYPEFDVPGHATSWLVAFPELASAPGPYTIERNSGIFDPTLNPTIEKTYEVLGNLFIEMTNLFPDSYFHIGGDENEGHHWDQNQDIQKFMKKHGIKDNHELQTYFNNRLMKVLDKQNKKMVGWDEILQPDLAKTAVIHSWRGQEGLAEAASQGYKTILSNGYYIDLMKPAYKHYLNDPIPANSKLTDDQKKNVLGGEATMWSELVTPATVDSRIWPRTAAIAERLWSPAEIRDVDSMYERMEKVSFLLEEHGLTHIRNRNVILRNLAKQEDIEALKVLSNVVEPLKGYRRNPGGAVYKTYSPFVLFADAAIADAPDARVFNRLVVDYLNGKSEAEEEIRKWLQLWSDNHEKLKPVIAKSPVLWSVKDLSENLSAIAEIGLDALDGKLKEDDIMSQLSNYHGAIAKLEQSREQGGRTDLQIVNSIKQLVKRNAGVLAAYRTENSVAVDGDLSDWKDASWDYFVPSKHLNWSDTCHFAIKWDKKNLYFAFKVDNSNLQALANSRDKEGLHMDDGIEFLLDTDLDQTKEWKDDDLAYHVNVLNAIIDDRGSLKNGEYNNGWNGNAKTAVKVSGTVNDPADKDKGYQVEIAISWKEIGKTPKDELVMGIDLCVNDRDDVYQQYRYFDYMNLPVFHMPEGFAKLVLVDKNFKERTSFEQE